MARDLDLPCDGDGVCMRCKVKPPSEETLTCATCVTPWHVSCLSSPPQTLASTSGWHCPDCSGSSDSLPPVAAATAVDGQSSGLIAAIRAIEADDSLSEREKARKRQALLSGKVDEGAEEEPVDAAKNLQNDVLKVLDGSLNCSFCMQLPERPVTTPCGHNFCLKCFQRWIGQGKHTCAKCRRSIPPKMASQPRINSALVSAIRMAKSSKNVNTDAASVHHYMHNKDRPDKAFTTERARRAGKANAASGRILVTVPPDHFGPITAEFDPERGIGVMVGECWEDRLECRQWGVHMPHVAGIAGQAEYGAQSVVLSGGYKDDEDHGEWFLYTGSGGRDLSGNRRTNKEQSSDQQFVKFNEALRTSCKKGYPVRVVRSHKEKRSAYAPEKGLRYDGIYRIEKCWRKVGIQGFKVCRYLFVRCDNDPAPWTSDAHGDRPRTLPSIRELNKATDITQRKESPSWNYDEKDSRWKWMKPAPVSKKSVQSLDPEERKRTRRTASSSIRDRLLREFGCQICRQVMSLPITAPCAHNFCKSCLEEKFAGQTLMRERSRGGRTLRSQRNVLKCPSCETDISDFIQNPQVNRELMEVIESLKRKVEESEAAAAAEESSEGTAGTQDKPTSSENEEPSADDGDIPAEKRGEDSTTCDDVEPRSKKARVQAPGEV